MAYYYDEYGIHANFGWGSNSTNVIIDFSEYQITEAGLMDFTNVVESHSNNYIVNDINYCGCRSHVKHDYSYKYVSSSTKKHKAYCACGKCVTQSHSVSKEDTFMRNGIKYGVCKYCNELIDLGNTIVIS